MFEFISIYRIHIYSKVISLFSKRKHYIYLKCIYQLGGHRNFRRTAIVAAMRNFLIKLVLSVYGWTLLYYATVLTPVYHLLTYRSCSPTFYKLNGPYSVFSHICKWKHKWLAFIITFMFEIIKRLNSVLYFVIYRLDILFFKLNIKLI